MNKEEFIENYFNKGEYTPKVWEELLKDLDLLLAPHPTGKDIKEAGKKIDNILEDFHLKKIDLLEVRKLLIDILLQFQQGKVSEISDEFAISFAEWCVVNANPIAPNKNNWVYKKQRDVSTQQLFELFKQGLASQQTKEK
jgi:hypothetical protein